MEVHVAKLFSKLESSGGSHSAPRSFPYENSLDTTEEDALRHGHTIIPVERDLCYELVEIQSPCGKKWDEG
ncbi:zinc-binding dehydrogenase [Colletotrichum higginsianum IMI 349063]|uniref:Zinc-binding dehydrogenase n=1 Tax=Colletotrichum higginsianum (strain IMI 349063) TaxID=759273 RepID=A0A1B7YJM3_COLHI|nr:zinc-binding dehydrogenase [Colletotrichum higginsianum IMI 349063]OBR12277.1 zinc-binding dehydrogenase [Colletotrichum higginsianum IMI 349063]GJC93960.1 zinc-binding dehydrogenase [Colletotrichum higginsianum]